MGLVLWLFRLDTTRGSCEANLNVSLAARKSWFPERNLAVVRSVAKPSNSDVMKLFLENVVIILTVMDPKPSRLYSLRLYLLAKTASHAARAYKREAVFIITIISQWVENVPHAGPIGRGFDKRCSLFRFWSTCATRETLLLVWKTCWLALALVL